MKAYLRYADLLDTVIVPRMKKKLKKKCKFVLRDLWKSINSGKNNNSSLPPINGLMKYDDLNYQLRRINII